LEAETGDRSAEGLFSAATGHATDHSAVDATIINPALARAAPNTISATPTQYDIQKTSERNALPKGRFRAPGLPTTT
jgi:hypothetical protein